MLKMFKSAIAARNRRSATKADLRFLSSQSDHILRDLGVRRDDLRRALAYGRFPE